MGLKTISFERIKPSEIEWNIIEESYDGTIYMTKSWFDYLTYQNCRSFIVKIHSETDTVGYFVGELKWRGVWLLGAPIDGVGTGNQGLTMLRKVEAQERISIYKSLAKWVFKKRYAMWIQIEDWQLTMADLQGSGLLYEGHDASWVDLTEDEDVLFNRMDNKSCRYKIRKAIKEGVQIKEATDPDSFLDVHYDQCLNVMHSKGLKPRRSKEHLRKLIKFLYPNHILLLEAVEPNGEIISTGMYPVSCGSASSFSSASYREYSNYCANEYIRWEAFLRCKARGAKFFNNNGCIPFKLKFGSYRDYKPRIIFARFEFLKPLRDFLRDFYHNVWRFIKYGYRIKSNN